VLRSDELARAWEYARNVGVRLIGPSVSDAASAEIALEQGLYDVMQLPFNRNHRVFEWVLNTNAVRVIVNRPFGMGAMLYGDAPVDKRDAFRFVCEHLKDGIVLTGTKSIEHLNENVTLWGLQPAPVFSPAARGVPSVPEG
jgi:hypothetical protein